MEGIDGVTKEYDYEKKEQYITHVTITHYLDYDITKENMSFSIFAVLTIFFIVQKLNDNLMAKWQAAFYPLYVYFAYNFIKYFIYIIKTESDDEADKENNLMKMENFSRITLISYFFSMVNFALAFMSVYDLAEFLDKKGDKFMISSLYMLGYICFSQILYSAIRKTSLFSIPVPNKEPEEVANTHSFLAFFSTISGSLLTYFSNMMIVCSSSSGVCTQIYMSTIASLLGAFGVTLSDFSDYLFPITVVLMGVSLFSLYIKNKKFTHPPFLLGVISAVMIILSHLFDTTNLYYLTFPGNAMMIAAAIWNARMNKFYGLPRYSK